MYIESRLNDNDARSISRLTNEDISLTIYHLLRECPRHQFLLKEAFRC